MQPKFFTQPELTIILYRSISFNIHQIADNLGWNFHQVNDSNKAIHRKVKSICHNEGITGTQVLGIAMALGELTPADLVFFYATGGIHLNNIP